MRTVGIATVQLLVILLAGCDGERVAPNSEISRSADQDDSFRGLPDARVEDQPGAAGGTLTSPMSSARDSVGIRIVQNEAPSSDEPWVTGGSPTVTIGGVSGQGDQELFRVAGALRSTSGTIVIANGGSSEIRSYGPTGELLWSAGRAGEGPGEFAGLSHVFLLPGDSLAAFDVRLRRISVFGPEGRFVRSVPIRGPPDGPAPLTRLPNDVYLMATAPVLALAAQGPTRTERIPMHMYRLSDEGQPERVAEVPGLELQIAPSGTTLPDGSPRYGRGPRLFGRSTTIVADGSGWVVADNDHTELQLRGPSGELDTVVRWNAARRSVTTADVEMHRAWDLARRSNPDEVLLRRIWSQAPDPPTLMPAYGPVLLDTDGNVWVGEYRPPAEGSTNRFFVFDRTGVWIANAVTPEGVQLLAVGTDWLLGLLRDDLGIESVSLYSLARQ